jgi:hypothetical protein
MRLMREISRDIQKRASRMPNSNATSANQGHLRRRRLSIFFVSDLFSSATAVQDEPAGSRFPA